MGKTERDSFCAKRVIRKSFKWINLEVSALKKYGIEDFLTLNEARQAIWINKFADDEVVMSICCQIEVEASEVS